MNLKFKLSENDYLAFHLFSASQSPAIARKRWNTIVNIGIIGIVLFFFSLIFGVEDFMGGLTIITLVLLFYPFYTIFEEKRSYRNYIRANYKNRIDQLITLEFSKETIMTTTPVSKSQVQITEINQIFENKQHIFIQLKSGECMIVPKYQLSNTKEFKAFLKTLSENLNVEYLQHLGLL